MTELEYLQQQHILGRLSRRGFLGRAAALGAGAALLSSFVASADAYAAETPKKGGTLRLGLAGGSTTDSLEPGSYTDSVMIDTGHALFNGLVEWAQDGKPVPELAESWEIKPGAAEWIFTIRKGVTFSNGKTLDADDIVYSLNLHRGATKSGAAGPFKAVSDVKKLGPNQVQVTLASGDADFAYVLTDYHVLVVPDGYKDWTKAIGTGGYVLDKFDPGVRITAKRNPNYWKPDRAHVDAVDITVINDSSARLNALLTGQVDACNRLDPKLVKLVEKNKKVEVIRAPGGWHTDISMMMDRDPYSNLDVRLAMKYGIDREQIIKALFGGFGSLGNDHPIPRTDPVLELLAAADQVRSGQGQVPHEEVGFEQPADYPRCVGRCVRRGGGHGVAVPGERLQGRFEDRREEGSGRRVLGQCVAQGAVRDQLLGRPRGGDADAGGGVRAGCAVERGPLQGRRVQQAALGGTCRDRRGQAQADDLGDAGDPARPGCHDRSRLPRLAGRQQQECRRPHAARRLRHGQRLHRRKSLVQGLIHCSD